LSVTVFDKSLQCITEERHKVTPLPHHHHRVDRAVVPRMDRTE
jgi:hypothetical protein